MTVPLLIPQPIRKSANASSPPGTDPLRPTPHSTVLGDQGLTNPCGLLCLHETLEPRKSKAHLPWLFF
jgi:hypothetical protein